MNIFNRNTRRKVSKLVIKKQTKQRGGKIRSSKRYMNFFDFTKLNSSNYKTQNQRLFWLMSYQEKLNILLQDQNSLALAQIKNFIPPYYKNQKFDPKFTPILSSTPPPLNFISDKEKEQSNILIKLPWTFGFANALTVVHEAQYYTNIFDVLNNNFFYQELNLHKTKESLLKQSPDIIAASLRDQEFKDSPFYKSDKNSYEYFITLEVSNWPVEFFFISALCYVLQNLLENSKNGPSREIDGFFVDNFVDNFHIDLSRLLFDLHPYYFSSLYSNVLFNFFTQTKLFLYYPLAAQKAFKNFLHPLCLKQMTTENFYVYKVGFVKYLKAFNFSFLTCDTYFNYVLADLGPNKNKKNGNLNKFFHDEFFALYNIYTKFLKICSCWEKKTEI